MVVTQTVLSVVIEVQPPSAQLLREHVVRLRDAEEASTPKYSRLRQAVPALHFMSLTVSPDDAYDPAFVLEANFDGPPRPFWAQIEAALGEQLRDMFRCCKPPQSGAADLFAAVTADGSRAPVGPLLEACTVPPAIFHQGNRGLDRARIDNEAALFLAARSLAGDPALRAMAPAAIHSRLRRDLLKQFAWLNQTSPARIGTRELLADWGRLVGFVVLAVVALCLPAIGLALVFKTVLLPLLLALAAIYFGLRLAELNTVEARCSSLSWLTGVLAVLVLAADIHNPFVGRHAAAFGAFALLGDPMACLHPKWFWILVVVLGAVSVVLGLLVWLRLLERADPSQDAPPMDPAVQRRIATAEDQTVQNHMISIVHIKPGILRAVLIRAGLRGLGYLLRAMPASRSGYLGNMRTIHFAHWGIISNGGRLMFHSNYDGSWESYLDDFIEKAHVGLTLAWTNGVGFPETRFLINDGATHGRQFKAWARHSMTESQFWFSAYKDLTVNQIERQARLAEGLRKATLTPQEAATWLLDL